jgi:hypothetical protein
MTTVSRCIGEGQSDLEAARDRLREGHLDAVRQLLPDRVVAEACRRVGHAFRERVLPPALTVLHMIAAALWPDASFKAAWDVVGAEAVESGSLSKARNRLPTALLQALSDYVAGVAANVSTPWAVWRGHRVVDTDGTCLSMEGNAELMAEFGTCNTKHGAGKFPLARVVVFMLWGTMTILGYAVGGYAVSEQALAMQLTAILRPGDLLVGDRHFAGANYYATWRARGVEFLTRVHQRLKIGRLRRLATYSENDFVADMPVNKTQRRADPTLPKSTPVRLVRVEARVRGEFKSIWLATSLLDATAYPAAEIASLYGARWRVETLYRQLKVVAGADVLRSKKADGIRNEIAARMMAINLVRIIMIEAAANAGKDPLRVGFSTAVRLVIATSLRMSTAPAWQLPALYELMLERVAADEVPERPGRNEPRAKRRETKHYEALKTSRAEWRARHAKAA